MGHGIGPQSLGASGQNPKSKPCGTPLDFNEKLRAAERAGKLPESFAKEVRADSATNYGTPLDMVAPETMGSLVKDPAGAFAANTGSTSGANIRKEQLANLRNPASPGGGSAGIQSDLEGLQSKLADLKSQIDNLAKTV